MRWKAAVAACTGGVMVGLIVCAEWRDYDVVCMVSDLLGCMFTLNKFFL